MTGLMVDAVSDIIALTEEDLQSPPDSTSGHGPNVIKSLTLLDDRMIRVLDLPTTVELAQSEAA